MSFEIPIFPLHAVLFPGMQLPLHIFEPRYRLMVRRCLEGKHFDVDQAFGVAMLIAGREGESQIVPASVGCLAEITQHAPLPDGRSNLMTEGRRRFAIQSVRTEDEYLVGRVEWLDDDAEASDAEANLESEVERTRAALESYLRSIAENSGSLAPDLMQLQIPVAPFEFSMWIGALLGLPPHEKQPLLETTSTSHRLQLEYSLLRRSEVIQRAFLKRAAYLRQSSDPNATDQFASLN